MKGLLISILLIALLVLFNTWVIVKYQKKNINKQKVDTILSIRPSLHDTDTVILIHKTN